MTQDTKAPERIWVTGTHQSGSWNRDATPAAWNTSEIEYVRADLLTAAEVENERLREALRKIGERAKADAYGSNYIICYGCSETHHAVEDALAKMEKTDD